MRVLEFVMSLENWEPVQESGRAALRLVSKISDTQYKVSTNVPIEDPLDSTIRNRCRESIQKMVRYIAAQDYKIIEQPASFDVLFKHILDANNFIAISYLNLNKNVDFNERISGGFNFATEEEAAQIKGYFEKAAQKAGLADHVSLQIEGSTLNVKASAASYFVTWYNITTIQRNTIDLYSKIPAVRVAESSALTNIPSIA